MRPDGLLELFLSHPERSEGTRIPELRNGEIFKKWSEMVLCCWGFHKNVSRETFLVKRNTNSGRRGDSPRSAIFRAVLKLTLGRHRAPNHPRSCTMISR